jgi:hypothetical protein
MGIYDILTYNGSDTDVILNYIALVLGFIPLLWMGTKLRSNDRVFCLLTTVFLSVFQIMLCLYAFDCTGISIVWSAICGFNIMLYFTLERMIGNDGSAILKYGIEITLVLFCIYCLVLWVYYAVVEVFLTTIAHACALVLGLSIGSWFKHANQELYTPDVESDPLVSNSYY